MSVVSQASAPLENGPMVFVCGMSRSGTTLLSTVLDSHSQISMGYELIPPPSLPDPGQLRSLLERGLKLADGREDQFHEALRRAGEKDAALFFKRCLRAGLEIAQVRASLEILEEEGLSGIESFRERLQVAWRLMKTRHAAEKTRLFGFKLNIPSYIACRRLFPKGRFIYILRDPRDVVASHRKRGFQRTIEQVCKAWNNYLDGFEDLARQQSRGTALIRYEDLVSQPRVTMGAVFGVLPVSLEESIFRFYESEAAVHQGAHPNADQLQRNFFTTSIDRWVGELTPAEADQVCQLCGQKMERYGYAQAGPSAGGRDLIDLPVHLIREKRDKLASRRVYSPPEYAEILDGFLDEGFEGMRLIDYVRLRDLGDRKALLLRHDVDHDHETALKIAGWESDRGLRATYCLLHSAWYYGKLEGGRYIHTRELATLAEKLRDLGHEVNFHNNLVVQALREGIDPGAVLEDEIAFFGGMGVEISGTSTHGDALCRQLSFRNWELFKECCDDRFGGPRTVKMEWEEGIRQVELGRLSMADFGLEYEAYDIARDVYLTDSGGKLRKYRNTPENNEKIFLSGRRAFGRKDPAQGAVAGVLTHPIWWEF